MALKNGTLRAKIIWSRFMNRDKGEQYASALLIKYLESVVVGTVLEGLVSICIATVTDRSQQVL